MSGAASLAVLKPICQTAKWRYRTENGQVADRKHNELTAVKKALWLDGCYVTVSMTHCVPSLRNPFFFFHCKRIDSFQFFRECT